MPAHCAPVCCPWRPEEGVIASRTGVTDGWSVTWVLGADLGSFARAALLQTAEPSLQPCLVFFTEVQLPLCDGEWVRREDRTLTQKSLNAVDPKKVVGRLCEALGRPERAQ